MPSDLQGDGRVGSGIYCEVSDHQLRLSRSHDTAQGNSMNAENKSAVCAAVAMGAGGFTYFESSGLSMFPKALLVGTVAAIVMSVMVLIVTRAPRST